MNNETIPADSHHFIIINDGNIKIHQSWISCYEKKFWDGGETENTHYLENCLGTRDEITDAKAKYGMNKQLPGEFLGELYSIITSKPTNTQAINSFCKKYCGVSLTSIITEPIKVNFEITYYNFLV